jgi:hypothetical protein
MLNQIISPQWSSPMNATFDFMRSFSNGKISTKLSRLSDNSAGLADKAITKQKQGEAFPHRHLLGGEKPTLQF